MNRFRTRKKAKEEAAARVAEDQPSMPSFMGFRRGKKAQEEEPKKEIDLTAALPPSDDFRTSLLMTGLSARFSMLREQDDPNTKIGKASDDSVLYPKRQSRLVEFGYGGLADIAEVESIRAPPSFSRMDSYIDDDSDSTKDSIMNRAKPTEGNNLFGGRQKIYKIPVGGSTKGDGAMVGRALYEDDVAQSAFQKWRNTEKQRHPSFEDDKSTLDAPRGSDDYQFHRSESPLPPEYNRKRETSSTTSSTPSITRNSTAATSVVSGPTPSIKDWQSQSTAPTSASSTPALDRNVTRTRRLYEPGLSQELHDQQSSALSRIDTLSGKRTLGSRTPDLAQHSPSPTTYGFTDRFGAERRPILSKASAPNLRSISPPTTASSSGTMEKIPALPEPKPNFAGTPPLSPPVSEGGDHPLLPIQPNDRGKATAMGVFQKPVQPYDESKYAQRQLQLQQGRETPTQRFRAESNASYATGRSRSSSAAPAQADAAKPEDEEGRDLAPVPERTVALRSGGHLRPSDEDHPAFRQLPTPSSMTSKISEEPSPVSESAEGVLRISRRVSPEDSPTLGPTAGLSGIVRQHLRSESDASSVYGGAPHTAGLESKFPTDSRDSKFMDGLGAKSLGNPWDDQDWHLSFFGNKSQGNEITTGTRLADAESEKPPAPSQDPSNRSSDNLDTEEDDFASQLANARRRVQERLTTYVESDSSRGASPLLTPSDPPVPPPARSNPLGILRGKSSRGSLMERARDTSQSRGMKMLGIGASTMSTTPSPSKQAFEEDRPTTTDEDDKLPIHEPEAEVPAEVGENETESGNKSDENIHPGLRTFRQARRELQKQKELETLARHQTRPDQPPNHGTPMRGVDGGRQQQQRTPSRDRKPPPVFYQSRAPSEEPRGNGLDSRSSSRPPSRTERDRSGSEASNGRSYSRPPRLRNNSSPYDAERGLAPNDASRQGAARSPGLPGTDIRRSPYMPPQAYPPPSLNSPVRGDRSPANGNLAVQQGRGGYEAYLGQPSPMSPLTMGLPGSPFMGPSPVASGASTPTTAGHRRPSAPPTPSFNTTSSLNESMKRQVNKNDISEPSFLMTTSRVPTVSLPQSTSSPDLHAVDARLRSGSRSRSGSNTGYAPPVPPINPMRKREGSRTRPGLGPGPGPFAGRRGDLEDVASVSSPHLPLSGSSGTVAEHRAMFSASDDEDEKAGRYGRPRKNSEAYRGNGRMAGSAPPRREHGKSPPFVATGPPASRAVITSTIPGGMI